MKTTYPRLLTTALTLMLVLAFGSIPLPAAGDNAAPAPGKAADTPTNAKGSDDPAVRAFQAGNEALKAARFDDAIAQYRAGLTARPGEPALLTNLSQALRLRGVARWNAAIEEKDPRANQDGRDAARKDWSEAAQTSHQAVAAFKGAPPTDPNQLRAYKLNRAAALATHAEAMQLVATRVDSMQAHAAWLAYQEFIGILTAPDKKAQLRGDALQMLLDAGDFDLALSEGRKILATEPRDLQATRVVGFALFSSGEKTKFAEAARLLQRYIDAAPDTDPRKEDIKTVLQFLKEGS